MKFVYAFTRVVGLFALLAAIGCDAPTAPTPATSAANGVQSAATTKAVQKQLDPTKSTFTFGPEDGEGTFTNTFAEPHRLTFALWNRNDPVNQLNVGWLSFVLQPGETKRFAVGDGGKLGPCDEGQPDFYIDLDGDGPYTMSFVANHLAAGGPLLPRKSACRNPPTPPVPPVCFGGATLNFPQGSYIATFPIGFPNPWYPSELGPFAFAIPAGTWAFTSVTGDNHTEKLDEYPPGQDPQQHEQAQYEFYHGAELLATSQPTTDIPVDVDVMTTNLGVLTFSKSVTSIRVTHPGPRGDFPNDSLVVITFTYSCPAEGGR